MIIPIRAAKDAILGYGPSVMATPVGRIGSSPYSLSDLRRRPGRSFFYAEPLDPVVTKAARSGSVPATTVAAGNVTICAQRGAASRFVKVGFKMERCERIIHVCDAIGRDGKARANGSDRPVYEDCGYDVESIPMLNIDHAVDDRTHGGLSARGHAVQKASRVVLSVVEQACDLLDTMRTHAAQCEDSRTRVHILDLSEDAEMAFEKAATT